MPSLRRKASDFAVLMLSLFVITLILSNSLLVLLMSLLMPIGGIYGSNETYVANSFKIKALHSEVSILLDSRLVPHIYAQNDEDLFYSVGFIHAMNRLWQMDAQRRAAEGKLSEIIGKDGLSNDILMRTIGLNRAANITASFIKNNFPSYYALYEAYAKGVNDYIKLAESRNALPLMFRLLNYKPEPWKVEDSIAFAKLMAWSLTNFYQPLKFSLLAAKLGSKEASKLYPIYPPFQSNVTVVPGNGTINGKSISVDPDYLLSLDWYSQWATGLNFSDPDFSDKLIIAIKDALNFLGEDPPSYIGSNNWAISPSKSTNGKAMLADDPHLALQIPSLWYEVDLHSPSFNVYGVTLAGIPAVIIGFNNKIAWGLTNTQMSVMDFYVEKINPNDSQSYYFNGEWKRIQLVKELINIRNEKPYELYVNLTIHGPILTRKGLAISAKWVGMDVTLEAIAIIDVMKAKNLNEFFNALRHWDLPSQNFMYADVEGNIAVIEPGKFPIRKVVLPNNERIEVLGSRSVLNGTGNYEWTGFIPFDLLPHSINPDQGFLAGPNQMSIGKYYPYFILGGWWDAGARAERIYMLLSKPKISLEDMMKAQSDSFQWYAYSMLPDLLNYFKSKNLQGDIKRAVDLLSNWNYTMKKDLEAPSVWWFLLAFFYNRTFITKFNELGIREAMLPYPETIIAMYKENPKDQWFNGDFFETAFLALEDAVNYLKSKYGDDWRWGRVHQVYFKHISNLKALSIGPYPEDGGDDTLMAAGMPLFGGYVTHGPSWRMIVILSDPPKGYGVYPGGQSENPASDHYSDFVNTWLNYNYYDLNRNETIILIIVRENA